MRWDTDPIEAEEAIVVVAVIVEEAGVVIRIIVMTKTMTIEPRDRTQEVEAEKSIGGGEDLIVDPHQGMSNSL